mgnify:CR=1 FL=1
MIYRIALAVLVVILLLTGVYWLEPISPEAGAGQLLIVYGETPERSNAASGGHRESDLFSRLRFRAAPART